MTSDDPVYSVSDAVRVRSEPWLSEVVLPTDRKPGCVPDGIPSIDMCCVPVALVRKPVGSEGVMRLIELRDLTRVTDTSHTEAQPESE